MSPEPPRERSRQHVTSWAYAGSQRQIQAYVNNPSLTTLLDDRIRETLPSLQGSELDWQAPLAKDRYAEPQDETFWPAIGRPDLAERFSSWWPRRGGPAWDAIALARRDREDPTIVLVEAKAHPAEFLGVGLGATSDDSIARIEAALDNCRVSLGSTVPLSAWTAQHYQLANRLAWAHKLRENGAAAMFLYVGFTNDLSNVPATAEELRAAAKAAHQALGLAPSAIQGWAATAILPATG